MTDILMAGNAPNPDGVASAVRKEQQWRCDFCRVKLFATLQEASAHEEECRTQKEQTKPVTAFFQPKKKTKKRAVDATSNDAVVRTVQTAPTKRSKQRKTAPAPTKSKQNDVIDLLDSAEKEKPAKPRRASAEVILVDDPPPISSKKGTKKKQAPSNPFFFFFSTAERKKLMEEQAAVEFQAKRLLQRERERKMRQGRAQAQPEAEVSVVATKPAAKPPRSRGKSAPLPVPAHVYEPYSVASTLPSYEWVTDAQLQQSRAERQVEPFCADASVSGADTPISLPDLVVQETLDPVQTGLQALISPPSTVSRSSLLWNDKYAMQSIDDVCGENRRAIAKELVSFVEEWMVERQKSVRRAAQRQKALRKERAKKKTKRKATYREDDDWLSDEDETKLNSVCLLTGPSGCGKTQLIHAIAKLCGCELLEISTAERRGAAALRKAIEEATQSHSSLDMLKKNQASFFGKTMLVDSDDEDEDDKASLTIILLDEVDNLFETNGDNGFWSALSDLTKRSKCPIFLTANSVPSGVASCYYTMYEIPPPSPEECTGHMQRILKQEGFSFRKSEEETCKALEDIASVCKCDLRRIALELQVAAGGSSNVECVEEKPMVDLPSPILAFDGPVVESIRPPAVHFDQYSLVTITGSHFMSVAGPTAGAYGYPVEVSIGSQACLEGFIMDDTTILTVCAPWQDRQSSKRKSWTSNYAPVAIHGRARLGRLSTSGGRLAETNLPDGTLHVSVGSPCNLEIHFEVPGRRASEDEEEEFGSDAPVRVATETTLVTDEDHEQASKLLQEGVEAWLSTHGSFASLSRPTRVPTEDTSLLDACRTAQLGSDAALLEDGLTGLPYLSGACPGYGYDLTGTRMSNENSKPPSEDSLFVEGWKDSAFFFGSAEMYMTAPMCPREIQLLRRGEATLRGWSIPTGEIADAEDADNNENEPYYQFRGSEEDAWLPNPPPIALESLPSTLRSAPADILEAKLEESSRNRRVEQMSAWLREYLLATTVIQARLNARGLTRIATDVLLPLTMSNSLALDYLPALRSMAVWEGIHEAVDKQTTSAVVSKRTTRRSRQVRKHYFESVSPAFEWEHTNDQQTSSQMGKLLADAYLRY